MSETPSTMLTHSKTASRNFTLPDRTANQSSSPGPDHPTEQIDGSTQSNDYESAGNPRLTQANYDTFAANVTERLESRQHEIQTLDAPKATDPAGRIENYNKLVEIFERALATPDRKLALNLCILGEGMWQAGFTMDEGLPLSPNHWRRGDDKKFTDQDFDVLLRGLRNFESWLLWRRSCRC